MKPVPNEGTNAIDFEGKFVKGGKGQSVVLKGICEINEDTLRLCYSYNDNNKKNSRHKGFESEEGIPRVGMIMRKIE